MKKSNIILAVVLLFPVFVLAGETLKIEQASQSQIDGLRVIVNPDVKILQTAAAVSAHHKRACYVGANISIPVPGKSKVHSAVWLYSGTKEKPGGILAVDGFAKEFSRATPADKTNPPTAYSTDDECRALKRYLDNLPDKS